MQKQKISLRLEILRAMLLPLLFAWSLTLVIALIAIYHEIGEVYDSTLVQYARLIADKTGGGASSFSGPDTFNDFPSYEYERKITYRVLEKDGSELVSSETAPPVPPGLEVGFSDHKIDRKPWRFFMIRDAETGREIIMAERYSIRHEVAFQLLLSVFIPALILAVVAFAAIWRATTQGLRRLTDISEQVDRRAAEDLSLIEGDIPVEIASLLDALNRLLSRLSESFSRERQFTDNAAHELRTPLAAIKTQAQVIARRPGLDDDLRAQVDNLLQASDRATALTESLLSFVRLQNDASRPSRIDLAHVLRKECEMMQAQAHAADITLDLDVQSNAFGSFNPEAIGVLMRNIVQNAIKFSPAGGRVAVRLATAGGAIVFSVADQGVGIAPAHREKVFERFYRIDKSRAPGTGLGLAMAKWVADLYGAQIEIGDNDPQGSVFTVTLPQQ